MIKENLNSFLSNIEIINDKVSIYKNEDKGLMYPLNTVQLLCRVDYLELDKQALEKAKFEQKIEDKEYKMYDCEKMVPKSDITKNKEDMFTLTKKTYKGTHIYNVSNQVGIHTTLENKEEAIKLCETINKEVLEFIK